MDILKCPMSFFDPLDFISKLVALVPPPKINLIRFIGVFAPNSHYREQVIIRKNMTKKTEIDIRTEGDKRVAMNWAQRLKRAFNIDIDTCEQCAITSA